MQHRRFGFTLSGILHFPTPAARGKIKRRRTTPTIGECGYTADNLRIAVSDLSLSAEVEIVTLLKESKVMKSWLRNSLVREPSLIAFPEIHCPSTPVDSAISQPSMTTHCYSEHTPKSSTASAQNRPFIVIAFKQNSQSKILEEIQLIVGMMVQYGTAILERLEKPTIDLDVDFSSDASPEQLWGVFSGRAEVEDMLREKYRTNHLSLLSLLKISDEIHQTPVGNTEIRVI